MRITFSFVLLLFTDSRWKTFVVICSHPYNKLLCANDRLRDTKAREQIFSNATGMERLLSVFPAVGERYRLKFPIVEPSSLPFSSILDPNICLRILFSNTLSLDSSLNVRDYVSQPYSTTGNIIVLRSLIF